MVWAIIAVVAVVMAVVIVLANQKHKKLVASGEIAERKPDFMKEAEDFHVKAADPQHVAEQLKQIAQNTGVGCKGSISQQDFEISGGGWVAALKKIEDTGEETVYRFQFLKWNTRNGMPEDALRMNKAVTAIEKMFASIDPGMRIEKRQMDVHWRPRLF